MKKTIIEFLASELSYDNILDILFVKISETHNLKESTRHTCDICNTYFGIKDNIDYNIKKGKL